MLTASFPALLQRFFTERLLQQRQASPHTIAAYRDTFRLLLRFAAAQLGRPPSGLKTEDLDPAFIVEFIALHNGKVNADHIHKSCRISNEVR